MTRLGGCSPEYENGLNLSSSVPDDPAAVAANRQRAYGLFDRSVETLVHAHLVHEAHVAVVAQADHGRVVPGCDALITRDPGCGMTMNYADCTPIVLYDPVQHAVGLGHAGWRGTLADVPGRMVAAMTASFGTNPADIIAGVAPCIGVDHYEVGQEVVEAVRRTYGEQAEGLLLRRPDWPRHHFDLTAANRLNLSRAGVTQIELSGTCTAERTDLFFSHRAEKGRTGRFGVVVILGRKDLAAD